MVFGDYFSTNKICVYLYPRFKVKDKRLLLREDKILFAKSRQKHQLIVIASILGICINENIIKVLAIREPKI